MLLALASPRRRTPGKVIGMHILEEDGGRTVALALAQSIRRQIRANRVERDRLERALTAVAVIVARLDLEAASPAAIRPSIHRRAGRYARPMQSLHESDGIYDLCAGGAESDDLVRQWRQSS
jgi:hypothetical protein